MRDIVIVPTYDRPEYLAVCLERLAAATGSESKDIYVRQERHEEGSHFFAATREVCDQFSDAFHYLELRWCQENSSYGNSRNVFRGLTFALEELPDRTYLIEDDVMVMEDFFMWHEAVQKKYPTAFVSVASSVNQSLDYAINGPEVLDERETNSLAIHISKYAYSSVGVCFPQKTLRCIVHPASVLPTRTFGPGVEQDILIKELMKQSYGESIWPYLPRAYHTGWYGYHRNTGLRFNGSLQEKIAALRSVLHNQDKISSMALVQNIKAVPTKQPGDWWFHSDPQFQVLRKFR